jgi:hypothetical protein
MGPTSRRGCGTIFLFTGKAGSGKSLLAEGTRTDGFGGSTRADLSINESSWEPGTFRTASAIRTMELTGRVY